MKMWRIVGALGTVVFTAVGFTPQALGQDERGFVVAVGDPVPAFKLTDIDGQSYSNISLLGTTYVLQFTASWCSVCRAEMPHLEREVWQRFASCDRGFVLLGVDYDEGADKVRAFAQQMEVTYPMCPDPEGRVFHTVAAPKAGVTRNVVVNDQGTVAMLTRLFDEEEFARMVELVDALTRRQ
jgi:peroxiredoxin